MTEATQLPIVIVGGGAAGLMAAIAASEYGKRPVLLLERTSDGGRKILISGGGRCNILPSQLDPRWYVTASSPNSMKKILLSWPLREQRHFFENEMKIPLKLEPESGKLFPASDRARDVRDGLLDRARFSGVRIRFEASVLGLVRSDSPGSRWRLRLGDGDSIDAESVILATGGLSVPATGSDGTGLRILEGLGHTVHSLYPALTPLLANPPVHAELAGVSLEATVSAPKPTDPPQSTSSAGEPRKSGDQKDADAFTDRIPLPSGGRSEDRGGFLFTHRGYSGPVVLNLSHHAVLARMRGESQPLHARWTEDSTEVWEERLRTTTSGTVGSLLRVRLPARLADRLMAEAEVDPGTALARLPREKRRSLAQLLGSYPLPWTGDEGYRKAEVTGGGVALHEVNPRTLESRIHPGLFLCGELLDAFGPIGGYNFAWAWATGRAAGIGAALTESGAA